MKKNTKSLEDILREYFGREKPFLDDPYYDEDELAPVVFTDAGAEAYGKLIRFVYAVHRLTGSRGANRMVDSLDSIASELY